MEEKIKDKNKIEETPTNKIENIEVKKSNKKRKKHNIFRKFLNLVIFLILLLVILSTFISLNGYNDFKNGKEPKYYLKKNIETKNDLKKTVYDFGLYRVEKHEDNKKYSYRLVPFFVN